jgi:hypothetical protein
MVDDIIPGPEDCPYAIQPEPECPSDIVLVSDGNTEWPTNAINIVSQDYETVTFSISNPYDREVFGLYYQYAAADNGYSQCYEESPLLACPEPILVTAHCMTGPEHPLAIVDLWLVDDSVVLGNDADEIPECCVPDEEENDLPTVLFSFKVYCKSLCERRDSRDLAAEHEAGETISTNMSARDFEAITKEEGAPVLEPSRDHSMDHFCTSDDYPCGDQEWVNVCHYSKKDGYQTFCVPESDSDVAAYFPKDYCGPCVGGYGGSSSYRN